MAAPSSTVWGPIITGSSSGRKGKLGIYTSVSNNDTQTTVNVQVWFWTIYSCTDHGNTLYYNIGTNVSSATTSQGSVSVLHSVESGSGWSTSNQTRILNKTHTYTRQEGYDLTYKIYARLSNIDILGKDATVSTTVKVPRRASYTIAYNANGGYGAPASQTKYHGTTQVLSSTTPTRSGYTFKGWSTSATGSVVYSAGGSYTANASATLYAVWEATTFTVTFDANGGSGEPSAQTKTYGVNLPIPSTIPKRDKYTFLGWSTSKTATTASYYVGDSYKTEANTTLYAVWAIDYAKPRLTDVSVMRCDSGGNISDRGTYAYVKLAWACDRTVSAIQVTFKSDSTDTISKDLAINGTTSGSVSSVVGDGVLSTEVTYTVLITVADELDSSTFVGTLPGLKFVIDILDEGKGIAFNKPAELEGVMDIGFRTCLRGGLLYPTLEPETDLNNIRTPGFYVGENVNDYNYANCPLASGTFTLEVLSGGDDGQTLQRLTRCHKTEPTVFERTYHSSAWGEWTGGWVYPTLSSLFSVYGASENDHKPRYKKEGNIVEIRGVIAPTSDIAYSSDGLVIFTLPEGYRPGSPITTLCQGSGNCVWALGVKVNGEVTFARYRNGNTNTIATSSNWLPFQVIYFAK